MVALAFTPDGAFIAGATGQQILIWKVDDVNLPRASWIRGSEAGWQTPQSHDSGTEEDQHSLCWDANGQKLAYGVNGLVCVTQGLCYFDILTGLAGDNQISVTEIDDRS